MAAEEDLFGVICIGAGYSGLTAAYTLRKAEPDLKICVLEAKDRIGGRTVSQRLKCANAEGADDECDWDMGGMWIGSNQKDIWQLLEELNIGMYKQHIEGKKCIRLDGDSKTLTYTSTLPSVGVAGTLDLAQLTIRMEKLIQTMKVADPWDHPEASYLDSISVTELLSKYSWSAKVKDMVRAAVRTIFGADASQINALYFLVYCAASGGLRNVIEATPGTAQEFKIKGGSQAVCTEMVNKHIGVDRVKLSSPVTSIEQTEASVVVTTAPHGQKYMAKYVIVATPPHLTTEIKFTPPLPYSKRKIYQFMPVGQIIKVLATYRQAYWRQKGFSGEVVTTDPMAKQRGALSVVYDASSEHGHPALVGFIGGDQATTWGDKSAEERRAAVLESLSGHFGIAELRDPIDYVEKDWAQEAYSGGGPVNIVTPGAMKFYKELKASTYSRIQFAGTESSDHCCGFISGAVNAGRRSAHKVLEQLQRGTD